MKRCDWATDVEPLYTRYDDEEWGAPVFKFVGPTICYAFMQAVDMVNDHTTDCFCYKVENTRA